GSFSCVLPLPVRNAVQAGVVAARIHVVDVLAGLRRIGRAGVAAQAPLFAADRILGNAAQEIDLAALRVLLVGHALDQQSERSGVAGSVGLLLDLAFLGRALVGIDRAADLAQRGAQVLLLAALPAELGERRRDRGQQADDRDHDQQLDQGEAARFHGLSCGCGCCCCCGAGPAAGGRGASGCCGCGRGCGCGCGCAGNASGAPPPVAPAPTSSSVPELNSSRRAPGRSMLRITRGVISSTISVLFTVSLLLENRRPMSGSCDTPGTRLAVRRSSSLIRPASTWVSPSRRRSVVLALRVPTW